MKVETETSKVIHRIQIGKVRLEIKLQSQIGEAIREFEEEFGIVPSSISVNMIDISNSGDLMAVVRYVIGRVRVGIEI